MVNIPIFTGLQDNELCTVVCRDNNVGCLLDPAMDPLIFPVQEEKCFGIFQVCHGTGKVICTTEIMWCRARKDFLGL